MKTLLIASILLCLQATAAHAISHSAVKTLDGAVARCAAGEMDAFAYRISTVDAVKNNDDVMMTLRLVTLTCAENSQNKSKQFALEEARLPRNKSDKNNDDKGTSHNVVEEFSDYKLVSYNYAYQPNVKFVSTSVDVRDDLTTQDVQLVLKGAAKELAKSGKTTHVVFLQYMYKVTVDGVVLDNMLTGGGSFNLILQTGPTGNVETTVK